MPRYLALDWDHQQLHLVAANVTSSTVRVQRALVWHETQSPNIAEAESLGKLLRDRLREAGIAPAPVLACIGRDRCILKDIRHPAVPEHEEPTVVRFQAIKELTDPPDEVIIDYTPAGEAHGERRALALIARRELLAAYQELCKAAGLKLVGLTPRPFGVVAGLKTLAQTPAGETVAVLAVAERWAEFSVARDNVVLFARSLNVGPTLAGEVRRNLAVYAGQAPQHPVKTVYVAGGEEHATFREHLQEALGIPVHSFDPLAGAERVELPDGARGSFAGAVGLIHAQASPRGLPINFAQPKQGKPPRDLNRQRVLVAALVSVLLLAGLFLLTYLHLSAKDARIAVQAQRLTELEKRERDLAPDLKIYDAIQSWTAGNVDWLDELYNVTALFPDPKAARLTQLSGEPQTKTGRDKDFVARMTLKGTTSFDSKRQVDDFRAKVFQDQYYRPGPNEFGSGGFGRKLEFTLKVETKNRPLTEYKQEIVVAAPPKDKEKAGSDKSRFKGKPKASGEGQQ